PLGKARQQAGKRHETSKRDVKIGGHPHIPLRRRAPRRGDCGPLGPPNPHLGKRSGGAGVRKRNPTVGGSPPRVALPGPGDSLHGADREHRTLATRAPVKPSNTRPKAVLARAPSSPPLMTPHWLPNPGGAQPMRGVPSADATRADQ